MVGHNLAIEKRGDPLRLMVRQQNYVKKTSANYADRQSVFPTWGVGGQIRFN